MTGGSDTSNDDSSDDDTGVDEAGVERRTSELRSFGRRRGRKLSPRQQSLLDELLPKVALDLARPAAIPLASALFPALPAAAAAGPTTAPSIGEVWLEIGFGGAEHLLWQARHNPGVGLIGCEPFEDGVVKALAGIDEHALRNLRLHPDDARPLLRWLPEASISRTCVLFPDPWPKKKHIKRRLVNENLLHELARVMPPGAELRIATDIADYVRTILIAIRAEGSFVWQAQRPADWRTRGPDWPPTRYEAKALREGRVPCFLRFARRA